MAAPKEIPQELIKSYTMNGSSILEYIYKDESGEEIQEKYSGNFTTEILENCRQRIKRKEVNSYWQVDPLLYSAFGDFSLVDKTVLIVGSIYPWYEAMALEYGCKNVFVSEYADRNFVHDKIKYIKPDKIEELSDQIDVCISISSFEHDGLGRYGDPLNPNGDLESMKKMKNIIKKDGLMFLAVPIGLDSVYFNIHRIYGKNRLPLLMSEYELIKQYGFRSDVFSSKNEGYYQPLFILKNIK